MSTGSVRDIIEIDEEKCDGCGLCVPSCAEGALAVIAGKLRVLDDARCDGAGACIGHCPQGALRVVRREAEAFDAQFAPHTLSDAQPHPPSAAGSQRVNGGCPGSMAISWQVPIADRGEVDAVPSALAQWPVQLHLLDPSAPFLEGCELLLCADCVAFAVGDFHRSLLSGRSLAIACPKLDDTEGYVSKLATILTLHQIPALRVAIMEVPCCQGLLQLAQTATRKADYPGEFEVLVVSRSGEIVRRKTLQQTALSMLHSAEA